MDLWSPLVLLLTLIHQSKSRLPTRRRIVCYMSQGPSAQYRLQASDIDPTLCTHIVYTAIMARLLPTAGESKELVKLKQQNPDLKLMLSVGGWMEGSIRFSRISFDAERRRWFAEYICKKLRDIGFDGLDLNWQWPGLRGGRNSNDKDNYAALVEELKRYFEEEGQKTGQSPLILSVVLPPFKEFLSKGYDLIKIKRYADFLNLLAVDYHVSIESRVAHPAPLYSIPRSDFNNKLTVDNTVQEYLDLGIDRTLMNLGIALYGRSYVLENSRHTTLGSRAVSAGKPGFVTRICGILAYFEICRHNKDDGWTVEYPNSTAMGPISYHGKDWVAYDDAETVRRKVRYAKEKGLGGVMLWTIDLDDFRGYCNESFPLMRAVKQAMTSVEIERDSSELRTYSDTNGNEASRVSTQSTKKNQKNPELTTNANTNEHASSHTTQPTILKQRALEEAIDTNNNENTPSHTSTQPSILKQSTLEEAIDTNNNENTPSYISTLPTILKQRNLEIVPNNNNDGSISHTSTQYMSTNTSNININEETPTSPSSQTIQAKKKPEVTATTSTQKPALPTININASLFHYVGTPHSKPIVIHSKNHTYKFQANQSFIYRNLWVQYNINCSDVC